MPRRLRRALGAAVFALLAAGCGGGVTPTPVPTRTPAATPDPLAGVAATYFADLKKDCASAYAMFDQAARASVGSESDYCGSFHDDNTSVDVGDVHRDDDTHASVAVTVHKTDGSSHDDDVDLVEVGGDWKVDNVRAASQRKGTSVLDFDTIPNEVAMQYQHNTGHGIEMNCPVSGKQALRVGDGVDCPYSRTDGTFSGRIRIVATVFNNYLWHTIDTASPAPGGPCTGAYDGGDGGPVLAVDTPCPSSSGSVPSA